MHGQTLQKYLFSSMNGDRAAFELLYNELKIPVFTVICRIVQNRTVAEDILHDVFMKVFDCPTKTVVKHPRAWIFKLARNAAIDELRKKRHTDCELMENYCDLCNNEYWMDTRIDLEMALCKLSAQQREVLTLHLNADFSFQQIAKITDSSLSAVYRTYRKAISLLKSELNGG